MEVSNQIIKVLDEVCKRFGLAIDWSKENVLPYVQELADKIVMYDMAKTIVVLVLSVLGLISVGVFLRFLLKEYISHRRKEIESQQYLFFDSYFGDLTGLGLICVFVFSIVGLLSILILFTGIEQLIQNLTFPELTVIEFIKPFLN